MEYIHKPVRLCLRAHRISRNHLYCQVTRADQELHHDRDHPSVQPVLAYQCQANQAILSALATPVDLHTSQPICLLDDDERMYFNTAQVRRPRGHVTLTTKSRSSQCNKMLLVRIAVWPAKKFSIHHIYCGKLAVMAMPELTPANRQMQQSPGWFDWMPCKQKQ